MNKPDSCECEIQEGISGYKCITDSNGWMQLGESNYWDHDLGKEVVQQAPAGFVRADHIVWNAPLEFILEYLSGLDTQKSYNIMVREMWKDPND